MLTESANVVDCLIQLVSEEEYVIVKTGRLPNLLYKLERDFDDYMSTHEDCLAACIAVQWFLCRLKRVLSRMLREVSQRAAALELAAALCCVSDSIARRIHAIE
jgi:hypothetical protein